MDSLELLTFITPIVNETPCSPDLGGVQCALRDGAGLWVDELRVPDRPPFIPTGVQIDMEYRHGPPPDGTQAYIGGISAALGVPSEMRCCTHTGSVYEWDLPL